MSDTSTSVPWKSSAYAGIRKAAYGRTELFLPSTVDTLKEMQCMAVIQRGAAYANPVLPAAREQGVACWHCGETVGEVVVPIPRTYDPVQQQYFVFGATCSPGCAKAYVIEHTHFDRGNTMGTLSKMLREVYGVRDVVEAPPRAALRRFGGIFDPAPNPAMPVRLVEPPFVSYCMLAEEQLASAAPASGPPEAMDQSAAEELEQPPPSMFADFLKERACAPVRSEAPSKTTTSSRKRKVPPTAGPMSRFTS